MRLNASLAAVFLVASTAAAAQDRVPVERRVDSLERQMRSVQRRVFADGAPPEAAAPAAPAAAPEPAADSGMADVNRRIDALERQLAAVTGQVEENANRIRALEEDARRARAEDDARLDRLEAGGAASAAPTSAAPTSTPADTQATPTAASQADAPTVMPASAGPATIERDPPSTDPAENAYLAGFRLWEAKRYDEAEGVLKTVVAQHPKHRRASWARNLLGRVYLDTGKPATAAEAFLSNYQDLPQGDRAADSLFFLGAALMKLNKPQQACKVYDELSDVYAGSMRDFLKQNLPAARKQAKCG